MRKKLYPADYWNLAFPDGNTFNNSPCLILPNKPRKSGYVYLEKHGFAYRAIYEEIVGQIPEGMELDHLCRNRRCINPEHLEPVTHRDNTLRSINSPTAINFRKTHCIRGHEFNEKNTIISVSKTGFKHRNCRICWREYQKLYQRELRKLKHEKVN